MMRTKIAIFFVLCGACAVNNAMSGTVGEPRPKFALDFNSNVSWIKHHARLVEHPSADRVPFPKGQGEMIMGYAIILPSGRMLSPAKLPFNYQVYRGPSGVSWSQGFNGQVGNGDLAYYAPAGESISKGQVRVCAAATLVSSNQTMVFQTQCNIVAQQAPAICNVAPVQEVSLETYPGAIPQTVPVDLRVGCDQPMTLKIKAFPQIPNLVPGLMNVE